MTLRLDAVSVPARDPRRLATFWATLLGGTSTATQDGVDVDPGGGVGFVVRFRRGDAAKTAQNHMHFDLTSSSARDQREVVQRALDLGAAPADVGQTAEEPHVVLADPEGNEFCVIEPGNRFLAGCGFVGALACDGSRQVGLFWSAVLGWPLVWDQGEETAIRSPRGGPKLTWGGPPFMPPAGRDRLRFDLVATGATAAGAPDVLGVIADLVALGAGRGDTTERDAQGWIRLADPDGQQFHVRVAV